MKEVKHYICEICGTEYNNKDRCVNCEKGHCKPVKIKGAKYLSLDRNAKGYPTSIHVEMEDGQVIAYKR